MLTLSNRNIVTETNIYGPSLAAYSTDINISSDDFAFVNFSKF